MDSEAHRLVHSITAHLALYHSHSSTPKHGSARASILRWFSSLSPARRQAALTILDSSFIIILLKMQHHLLLHGYAHFLILPDVPSTPTDPTVPSLSFRSSRGLIYRADASNSSVRILSDSLLFFSSASSSATLADSLSVSESLVTDVDSFVGVMDGISGGGFLCEEVDSSDLTVKWMELPWLKGMGHYSFEAFVTNRIEVALRLAWISSQGVKKPKDKKLKEWAAEVSGKAANAFWRMKGCLDWWVGLDLGLRRVIISAFFGNASRAMLAGQ